MGTDDSTMLTEQDTSPQGPLHHASPPPPHQRQRKRTVQDLWREEEARIEAERLSDNETEYDVKEAEAYLDTCPSPYYDSYGTCTPAYKAKRKARKPLSPPATPPHVKAPRPPCPSIHLPTSAERVHKTRAAKHTRRQKHQCHRRPCTRAMPGTLLVSLADTKGRVLISSIQNPCGFNQYLGCDLDTKAKVLLLDYQATVSFAEYLGWEMG